MSDSLRDRFGDVGKMDLSSAQLVRTFPSGTGVIEIQAMAGKPEACSWIHTRCLHDNGRSILDPEGRCVDKTLRDETLVTPQAFQIWERQYQLQEKRVSHCLRRLREKKLIADTDQGLTM